MDLRGWNVVDAERGVLWREYEFSKGAWATTLVFRGAEGLVVVSPGSGLDDAAYDVLKEFGEVRALVANNVFHHLGQGAWRAHFPGAESFAAPSVLGKLGKKNPNIPFRSIAELALLPAARARELDGFKTGELIFTLPTEQGSLWYSGDLLTNIQRTPGPPIRWLFTMTDSAPGFRLFKPCVWFFVKDKAAVKKQLTALLAEDPPSIIVPAHGPAFSAADVAARAKEQLSKL